MGHAFIEQIEHFAPHVFQALEGEGLYRSHSHESDELTLILDGEGSYTTQGHNILVARGDLILIPANLYHGFVCLKAWKGISVHFLKQEVPSYCQYLVNHAFQQNPDHILVSRLNGWQLDKAELALRQLEEERSRTEYSDISYDLMRNALESLLLSYHANASESMKASRIEQGSDNQIIQDALKVIHSSYQTGLKISDLANHYFLSENIFRKKFTEMVGISPKQYIISLRLNEAKRLLQHTQKPIEWISSEVGFTSSSRFHELFVKHFGKTPLEWRKREEPNSN
jgi:AraC-like DNA-binding protein